MARIGIITDRVSAADWASVDKALLRRQLVEALERGDEGAAEAIREVYAAIRSTDPAERPGESWWGPHHELASDGVVLNRQGLAAAAAALAGARTEPDLDTTTRRRAAQHLLRHYRELGIAPPPALLPLAGEMMRLAAELTGEVAVEDIPVSAAVRLDALRGDDPDPLQVVVAIPEGRSRRGWVYTEPVLDRIAAEVNASTLHGFFGHQRAEDVDHQALPPVTHWIGATKERVGERAVLYVRGLVDRSAADLKRWIRAGVIRQVSIFGLPTLQRGPNGETLVVDYQPLSIDWTPLNRNGMPTAVVALGEMDSIDVGPGARLKGALKHKEDRVTLAEILGKLRDELRARNTTVAGICGELGLTFEQVAQELDGSQFAALRGAATTLGEIAGLVGLAREATPAEVRAAVKAASEQRQALAAVMGEMAEALGLAHDATAEAVVAAAKAAREAQEAAQRAAHATMVERVLGEMVPAEKVRPLVKRMLPGLEGRDEPAVREAVGELLKSEDVKAALAHVFGERVPQPLATNREDQGSSGLVWESVAI